MLKTIKILFEDEYFLALDKPAGLLSTPGSKKERKTLIGIVNLHHNKEKPGRFLLCHRLDRDTSGVILLAKSKKAQEALMQEFHRLKVQKIYIAFVQGKLPQKKGKISFSLENKKAVTYFEVLDYNNKGFTIAKVQTLTGRTNQVRKHFKMISHPLLGERKFAFAKDFKLRFRRAALHAISVEFMHPFFKKTISIEAPLAKDMEALLD